MSDTPLTDAKERELENQGPDRKIYYGWKFARQLERKLADLKTIQQDNIDAENEWRAASGPWDKSDSFCTETAATVIERLSAQLAERDAMLAEYVRLLSKIDAIEDALRVADVDDQPQNEPELFSELTETWEKLLTLTSSLPATAQANAKIIEAAEEQERARYSWVDISTVDLYLNACKATDQAVRAKRELKP